MNGAVVLAVLAGAAIAVQVVVNGIGLRDLGVGGLIAVSGLTTGVAGLAVAAFSSRPEFASKALLFAAASGLLGTFILGGVVVAAQQGGLARTLSLVLAAQLLVGLALDRLGLSGTAPGEFGLTKLAGIVLVLAGGLLLVRG